uniref:Uncharacterized protein n=1 Tax=Panagrolaimus davidi TaxID=227884 RepID=A0A914PUW6_9BILA
MLAKLGLEPSDVVFVTDEGQNMVSAFQYDQELIKCICHGLHTIAKRSLKPYIDSSIVLGEVTLQYLADMEEKIGKLKKLIGAIRSRLNLHDSLTVRLGLEGDTRWLTKINMVDKYLKLAEDDHSKIDNYFRNEKDTELRQLALDVSDSKEDLVYFSTIFGPFQEAIRRLERDKSPTMNKVLETFYSLKEKITSFNNSDIPMLSELSISILAVMDHKERILINDNHLISVTLDPSKKNDLFNMIGREKFEIIKQKFEDKIRGIVMDKYYF